jgi:ferritin-like metal-binding protein YciE
MTKKERKAGHRRGQGRSNATKDPVDNKFTKEDDDSATASAQIQPKEIFDSSKYDAPRDMNKGSDSGAKDVKGFALGERTTNSLEPERINNEELTKTNARPIRKAKVEEKMRYYFTPFGPASSSHRSEVEKNMKKKFVLYLNILLSIENAGEERLRSRILQSPLEQLKEQFAHHLEETREQKSRLIVLVQNLGDKPTDERADMSLYSLPKRLTDALKTSATTTEEQELRMIESDALIEYAEILGYNMAIQLATKINMGEALMPLRQSLQEEEKMVAWMRANLPSNFVQLWSKIGKE